VKVSDIVLVVLVLGLTAMTVVWFRPPRADDGNCEGEEK